MLNSAVHDEVDPLLVAKAAAEANEAQLGILCAASELSGRTGNHGESRVPERQRCTNENYVEDKTASHQRLVEEAPRSTTTRATYADGAAAGHGS